MKNVNVVTIIYSYPILKDNCNFNVKPTHLSLLICFSILFDQVNLIVKVTPMTLVITLAYLETTLTFSITIV